MRTIFSAVAAFLLVCAVVQAQPKGRGGGFIPKNKQVLAPAVLPAAMQSYVEALGLLDKGACNYCEDRASDEKTQKVTARNRTASSTLGATPATAQELALFSR